MEVEEIWKTTVTQQMAEKYHDKPSKTATIPPKYQSHAKVFSEKEAKRFPLSREWDHWIPLKKDAPDSINAKMFSLPQPRRFTIQTWVQKMLDKGFIQQSDSKYDHSTFTVPKKDGTFRIVQDFRPVNKYTEKDVTPLLSIQEAIEGLGVTHRLWYISDCFVASGLVTIWIWDRSECGLPFLEPSDHPLVFMCASDGGLQI